MLQVQVKLKMDQPKCKARVEIRPAPEWAREGILKSIARRHEEKDWLQREVAELPKGEEKGKLSVVLRDIERDIEAISEIKLESLFDWSYVAWEPTEGSVNLGDRFTKELLLLAYSYFTEKCTHSEMIRNMVDLYDRWGPVFKETISEFAISQKLTLLVWTALAWGYRFAGAAMANVNLLNSVLVDPLRTAQKLWPEYAARSSSGWTAWTLTHGKGFSFFPASKETKGWEVLLPTKLPDQKKGSQVISWGKRVVLANVNRVLKDVVYKSYSDSQGNLRLIAQPKDAFSLALLRIIWGDGNRLRKCACGCGLHTFNKWYHPSHQRRGQVKQNELSYWRLQKDRGKFSKGEYELIKAEINRLWSEGIQEKDKLRKEIKTFVAKKSPRP